MRYLVLVIVLASGLVPFASAAQLDAAILEGQDTIKPSFEFLRVVYIEYPEGGEIAEQLRGQKQTITFDADSTTPGVDEFVTQLNQNLMQIPSNSLITDAKVSYQAILQGNQDNAVIEYKIQLVPTITKHILKQEVGKSVVDASWRGISISSPIIISTEYGPFDINNPKSALDVMFPDVSEKIDVSILELPLVDASGIIKLPLHKWHSLFDNTAIIQGAKEFKYTGENVITHYSMGECSIDVGPCDDREWIQEINLDKKYTVRILESRDDATIAIEGYVDTTNIGGIEVFQTNLKSPVTQKPDTDEFPASVMYGMAGLAVVGAVVMFVISNRKLKNDKNEGQTGIDPANLKTYETSSSSGSYKTNRGESVLVSDEKSKMPL